MACKANGDGHMDIDKLPGAKKISEKSFEYKGADCFLVNVPEVGAAQAIFYDVKAIKECIRKIKENKVEEPIVYVLACRIDPFFSPLVKLIYKLAGKVYVNPDGKCGKIESTEEKPVKSWLNDSFVAYHNYREIENKIFSVNNRNSLCSAGEYDINQICEVVT